MELAVRIFLYWAPNDEAEQERLDIAHALMTKAIGEKLFLCPIDTAKMQRILGNDLSPIQPSWVPPNVKFQVDDVESPWLPEAPYDFIFSRYMAACIKDWPKLVGQIHANLAPGGWAEFQDFEFDFHSDDGTLTPSSEMLKWVTILNDAADSVGRTSSPGPNLEKWVQDAGFVNVRHEKFRLPLGPWPKDPKLKEVGRFNLMQMLSGLEAFSLRLYTDVLGWEKEEVMVMLAKVRGELRDSRIHAMYNFHVVYGQKAKTKED
ncbi:hypothetical protein N0V88_007082 [Collariella sp. IMI 366227]|nr:hypothetical protein N0V88_007082 [Collariella sp. IMI 366227]